VIARSLLLGALACALTGCPPAKGVRNAANVQASDLPNTVTDLNKYIDDQYKQQNGDAMENSLVAVDKALGLESNYETLWRGARAAGWLTDEYPDRRAAYAERGVKYAEQAVALDSKRVEGEYFLGINQGQLARAKNARHLVPKVLEAGKAALAIDPRYDNGGPPRLVGALLAGAPEPPTSVGDLEEGLKTLKQALEIAPKFPLNHLLYADALLKNRDFDGAEREYNVVLNTPPSPQWAARLPKWQKDAESGLVHVRNKRNAPP
jgi:tetratricopeptide (TPR) repeat protein